VKQLLRLFAIHDGIWQSILIIHDDVPSLYTAHYLFKDIATPEGNVAIIEKASELLFGAFGAVNGGSIKIAPLSPEAIYTRFGLCLHKLSSEELDGHSSWCFLEIVSSKMKYGA